MGIFQRLINAKNALFPAWLENKISATSPLFAKLLRVGEPIWSPRTYEGYAKEGYSQNAIVFRCIDLISKGGASVPWSLRKGDKEVDTHPVLDLLKKPNPFQGGHDLFRNLIAYFLIQGDGYIEGVTSGLGDFGKDTQPMDRPPTELYTLRPDRMLILPGDKGTVAKYRYKLGDYKKDWLADQLNGQSAILHWKSFNPLNDWNGLSAIAAGATSVDQHNKAGAWNKALLDNSGQPSGVFQYAPQGEAGAVMPNPTRRQLEQDIDERMAGAVNAGRPWIIDGGLSWQEMGLSPKDMDWLKGKNVSAMEICAIFGVPTQMLGLEGSQTFANYAEARMSLYEDVIIPLMDCIADLLNNWLMPLYGDTTLELRPELDNLPALQPKREKQWAAVQSATWLTPNEKREATGYEKFVTDEAADPADMLYNASTLTALGAPPPAPIDPLAPDAPPDPKVQAAALAKNLVERHGLTAKEAGNVARKAFGISKEVSLSK